MNKNFVISIFILSISLNTAYSALSEEQKELITSLSSQINRIDANSKIETKCNLIQNFHKFINKDVYKDSHGRYYLYKAYNKIFSKQFITVTDINNEFESFKENLDCGNGDKFLVNFAIILATMFNDNYKCMDKYSIILFVYRFMESGLCNEPRLFLTAFLANLNEDSKLFYVLDNTMLFVKTDEKLESELMNKFESDPEAVIESFISLYISILKLKAHHDGSYTKDKIHGTIDKTLKTGGLFLSLYGLYQLRTWCLEDESNSAWFFDNVGLYQITALALHRLKQHFQKIDQEKKMHHIPYFFDSDTNTGYTTKVVTDIAKEMNQEAQIHLNEGGGTIQNIVNASESEENSGKRLIV